MWSIWSVKELGISTPSAGYAIKEGGTVGLCASEYTADVASHPEGESGSCPCAPCVPKNCPGVANESGAPVTIDKGSCEALNLLVTPSVYYECD